MRGGEGHGGELGEGGGGMDEGAGGLADLKKSFLTSHVSFLISHFSAYHIKYEVMRNGMMRNEM